jgi:hypothetical protein
VFSLTSRIVRQNGGRRYELRPEMRFRSPARAAAAEGLAPTRTRPSESLKKIWLLISERTSHFDGLIHLWIAARPELVIVLFHFHVGLNSFALKQCALPGIKGAGG